MLLTVEEVRTLVDGIRSYVLVDPEGSELPEFLPGAHVELHLDNGMVRQYSLCGDPRDRRRYTLGILRESDGRGGSAYIHDNLRVGCTIETSLPRNHFRLVQARNYIFIAGGIGITPILPMLRTATENGANCQLFYCTRSIERTAFHQEVLQFRGHGSAIIHHDNGDPTRNLNFSAILADYDPGTHLYYCGPPGLMAAVAAACAHWPAGTVHCEHFSAPAEVQGEAEPNRPFRVRVAGTGAEYEVPANETIVSVLRRHGVAVETSCEDGYCGTCMTRYTAGEPLHRDTVLDEESRKSYLLICCSRSMGSLLEIDI